MNLTIKLDRYLYKPNYFVVILIKHLEPKKVKWVDKAILRIEGAKPHLLKKWKEIIKEYNRKTSNEVFPGDIIFQEIEFTTREQKRIKTLILAEKLQ